MSKIDKDVEIVEFADGSYGARRPVPRFRHIKTDVMSIFKKRYEYSTSHSDSLNFFVEHEEGKEVYQIIRHKELKKLYSAIDKYFAVQAAKAELGKPTGVKGEDIHKHVVAQRVTEALSNEGAQEDIHSTSREAVFKKEWFYPPEKPIFGSAYMAAKADLDFTKGLLGK